MPSTLDELLGRLAIEYGLVDKDRLVDYLSAHVGESRPLSLAFFQDRLIDETQLIAIRELEQNAAARRGLAGRPRPRPIPEPVRATLAGAIEREITRLVVERLWRLAPPSLIDRIDRLFLELLRKEAGVSMDLLDREALRSLVPGLVYMLRDAAAADRKTMNDLLTAATGAPPPAEGGEDELNRWEHWWTRNAASFQQASQEAGAMDPVIPDSNIFLIVDEG